MHPLCPPRSTALRRADSRRARRAAPRKDAHGEDPQQCPARPHPADGARGCRWSACQNPHRSKSPLLRQAPHRHRARRESPPRHRRKRRWDPAKDRFQGSRPHSRTHACRNSCRQCQNSTPARPHTWTHTAAAGGCSLQSAASDRESPQPQDRNPHWRDRWRRPAGTGRAPPADRSSPSASPRASYRTPLPAGRAALFP